MTEDEIMIRAREAYITDYAIAETVTEIRGGGYDNLTAIKVAARALRDAAKPLSEIAPPDPDLVEAREIANHDYGTVESIAITLALAGIKRGRALAGGAA